ncbi:multisubunit sodium/proton antiporter MrpB subunit [Thioalkalivibrio sp. ALE21]|uniref:hydrogenase subunit MbhD domain-containing protein n=1 Tax=Thioalkalivibrio sp. ALE21 TaxID=1158175 RepID=UPI000D93B6EA|nr:hydrogenase subunit MbhD domain-containing protein [Thioalkalivibrio sp. ALE21]PYG01296.1 multisubunit sodium/proton antiporter MrpB subunit [Thioalkalivibrio sp. ALE21]
MNAALLTFDVVLLAGLLGVAWRCLASTDLFRAVVLFITFGLLLAIAWVRLEAPDIALAEAAIGAGITGALLLVTLERLKHIMNRPRTDAGHDPAPPPDPVAHDVDGPDAAPTGDAASRAAETGNAALSCAPAPARGRWITLAVTVGLAGLLMATLATQEHGPGLQPTVADRMDVSGVDHGITAVLLNFRSWDTLLELAMVLLAGLGAWSLGRHDALPARPAPGPVLPGAVRLLLPVAIVTGVYLLWAGSHAPGGAFQAGAVLGAAGILVSLARPHELPDPDPRLLRIGVTAGALLFLAIGLWGLFAGPALLTWPRELAYPLILIIETGATLSIALTLVALFIGGRSPREDT